MAGIDKIYLTKWQYYEFYEWCEKHQSEMYKDTNISFPGYFYKISEMEDNIDGEYPATNFPTEIDNWLMENCPFDYIQKRLKVQYSM